MPQSGWLLAIPVLYLFLLICIHVAYHPHRPGPFNLSFGAGIFSKIWPACRQYEIQYTEQKMFKCTWADHLIPGLIFFPGNYNT